MHIHADLSMYIGMIKHSADPKEFVYKFIIEPIQQISVDKGECGEEIVTVSSKYISTTDKILARNRKTADKLYNMNSVLINEPILFSEYHDEGFLEKDTIFVQFYEEAARLLDVGVKRAVVMEMAKIHSKKGA